MLRRIPPKNMEVPRALPVGLHESAFIFFKISEQLKNGKCPYFISFFFPNSGSIFTRPVTMNPGIVAAMTQRK